MDDYSGYDNLEVMTFAHNYNKFLKNLLLKHIDESSKTLDFGAGVGTFAKLLQKEGRSVTCLEPDKKQAELIADSRLKVVTALEDVENETIDFIYSLNVLEHIEDDREAIQTLKKKLRKGGKLLIYVPAFELLFSSMDKKIGHYRRYTAKSLFALANACELEIKEFNYADSAGFFATLLYKIVGSSDGSINMKALKAYDTFVFPISRIMDFILSRFLGKNVYIVLQKT